MNSVARFVAIGAVVLACVSAAQAQVVIETVTVGNPGNADDTHGDGYGSVGYIYEIGKYEVTAGQYTEFLNDVADDDTYGLYNENMWISDVGCKIERTGSSPNYSYSVAGDLADRPVNYVSWYDTLRFANWMHNGQPTGAQDASTTEDGAYVLTTQDSVADCAPGELRCPWARVFLTSEDEWYKAAYYKSGSASAGYWDYPTETDEPNPPTAEVPPGTDMDNGSANYSSAVGDLTDVDAYTAKPSDSAYGTFDQGGNVWEWNEAADASNRCQRGGA